MKKIIITLIMIATIAPLASITCFNTASAEPDIMWLEGDYSSVGHFSEGLASFRSRTSNSINRNGYIDKTGKEVIPHAYYDTDEFSGGLARVTIQGEKYSDKKVGYIDKTGKEVIPIIYYTGDYLSEGLMWVKEDSKVESKYGCIDITGKVVIPFIYDQAWGFSEGLVGVGKDDKWGYIDKTGEVVIPFIYGHYATPFREGLAAVRKDDKWGYIDKKGKEVIPFIYEVAGSFSEGIAPIAEFYTPSRDTSATSWMQHKKYGLINKSGEEIIPCIYTGMGSFSEGMAVVEIEGKWGYIDKTGKEVIPLIYDGAGDFSEGLATVIKDGKGGYIDKTGEVVIPFIYSGIRDFSEGVAAVRQDGKWGLIRNTYTIKVIVNDRYIKFDQLPMIESDRVLVPLRAIFEALDVEVDWNEKSQTVSAVKDDTKISLQIENNILYKNGEEIVLDVPAKIVNDRTLVPIRAVSEGLGARVEWDGDEYAVRIWME